MIYIVVTFDIVIFIMIIDNKIFISRTKTFKEFIKTFTTITMKFIFFTTN
jgi:hypothetical protein